jgi:hypothetical protein
MGDRDGRLRNGEFEGVSLSRFEGVDAISPLLHWLFGREWLMMAGQEKPIQVPRASRCPRTTLVGRSEKVDGDEVPVETADGSRAVCRVGFRVGFIDSGQVDGFIRRVVGGMWIER